METRGGAASRWHRARRSRSLNDHERPEVPPARLPGLGVEARAGAQIRRLTRRSRDLRPKGDTATSFAHDLALCRLRSHPPDHEHRLGELPRVRCRSPLVHAVRPLRSREPLPVHAADPRGDLRQECAERVRAFQAPDLRRARRLAERQHPDERQVGVRRPLQEEVTGGMPPEGRMDRTSVLFPVWRGPRARQDRSPGSSRRR